MEKELCKKLIKWYEDTIGLALENPGKFSIFSERNVDKGICKCATMRFGEDVYCDDYILERIEIDSPYVHDIINDIIFERSESEFNLCIESLRFRVNVLKEILKAKI